MTAQERWDHYDMLMRCWRVGRKNPAHPYYKSKKPARPECPRPAKETVRPGKPLIDILE